MGICGKKGPIITKVKDLLIPTKIQDIRIKFESKSLLKIKASSGVRIVTIDNLENAVPGSDILRPNNFNDELEINRLCCQIQKPIKNIIKINKSNKGVHAQASTLGSLEVLVKFLEEMDIPVNSTSIGTVYKKDVMYAISMLDKAPEYSIILAFDIPISIEAKEIADKHEIKIFRSDV